MDTNSLLSTKFWLTALLEAAIYSLIVLRYIDPIVGLTMMATVYTGYTGINLYEKKKATEANAEVNSVTTATVTTTSPTVPVSDVGGHD